MSWRSDFLELNLKFHFLSHLLKFFYIPFTALKLALLMLSFIFEHCFTGFTEMKSSQINHTQLPVITCISHLILVCHLIMVTKQVFDSL